jgi:outer membrane protein
MKFRYALALVLALVPVSATAEMKLGFVDLQRALNESTAGKKAKEDFKKQVDKLQGTLQKQKEQIDGMKTELEKKAMVMKEDDRRNLEKDYQRRLRDFERSYKDSQGELQLKDSELTADLLKQLQEVIEDFCKRNGYTMILDSSTSSVLYGDSSIDMTAQIIQAYDERKR